MGRPSRQVDPVKLPFQEVPGLCSEEPFGRSRAVSSLQEVIVDGSQCGQLSLSETLEPAVIKSQLPVTSFNSGTGALKQVGAFLRHRFNQA